MAIKAKHRDDLKLSNRVTFHPREGGTVEVEAPKKAREEDTQEAAATEAPAADPKPDTEQPQ